MKQHTLESCKFMGINCLIFLKIHEMFFRGFVLTDDGLLFPVFLLFVFSKINPQRTLSIPRFKFAICQTVEKIILN